MEAGSGREPSHGKGCMFWGMNVSDRLSSSSEVTAGWPDIFYERVRSIGFRATVSDRKKKVLLGLRERMSLNLRFGGVRDIELLLIMC